MKQRSRSAVFIAIIAALLVVNTQQQARSAQSFQCRGGNDEVIRSACGARWEAANIRAHVAAGQYGGAPPACLNKTAELLDQAAARWLSSKSAVTLTNWPCGEEPAVASADDGILDQACPNMAWTYDNRGVVSCEPAQGTVGPPPALQQQTPVENSCRDVAIKAGAPMKIGVVLYSGDPEAARSAAGAHQGFLAYLGDHGGAIGGHKVSLVDGGDGKGGPEMARRMAQELIIEEHVDLLIADSTTADVVSATANAARLPMFVVDIGAADSAHGGYQAMAAASACISRRP